MSDLQSILTELGEEKATIIEDAISSERERGIDSAKKKQSEVVRVKSQLNSLKDSIRALDIDPDQDIGEQINTFKATNNGKETELQKLQREVKNLSAKLQTTEAVATEKAKKISMMNIKNDLSSVFGDRVPAKKFISDSLINNGSVRYDEDSQKTFWVSDGIDMELKDGVDSFLKENMHLVKNPQKPGSSSTPGNNGNGGNANQMHLDDFNQLSPKAKSAYMANGGTLTD